MYGFNIIGFNFNSGLYNAVYRSEFLFELDNYLESIAFMVDYGMETYYNHAGSGVVASLLFVTLKIKTTKGVFRKEK